MRKITTALVAAAALISVPAFAAGGGVGGIAVDGHFDSSAVNGTFSADTSGNTHSESGSGFNAVLGGSNGGAVFGSEGLAIQNSQATPFTTTTTSFHEGVAGGYATSGASFNAPQVSTFAQGNANSAFSTHLSGAFDQQNVNFNGFAILGGFSF